MPAGSRQTPATTETKFIPVIARCYGIILRMMKLPDRRTALYANNGEHEVVLDAATRRVIAGNAPSRLVDLIIEWARPHQAELIHALEVLKTDHSPSGIVPLV